MLYIFTIFYLCILFLNYYYLIFFFFFRWNMTWKFLDRKHETQGRQSEVWAWFTHWNGWNVKSKIISSDLLWLWRGSQIFLVFTHGEQGLEQLGHLRDQGLDCEDIRSSKPWKTCGQVGKEAKSKVEVCGERRQRWWNKDRCRKYIKGVHEAGK